MVTDAILFDLHGTLARVDRPVTPLEASAILNSQGCNVPSQTWKAALDFVSMFDFPRNGYSNVGDLLSRVLERLEVRSADLQRDAR